MEASNVQKMREIIKGFSDAFDGDGIVYGSEVDDLLQQARAALALPLRQCDVGTADEQSARYDEFCYQHRTIGHCCANCPVVNSATCELAWAQTPYEAEEGAGE